MTGSEPRGNSINAPRPDRLISRAWGFELLRAPNGELVSTNQLT
jgi:hypothetical protein